ESMNNLKNNPFKRYVAIYSSRVIPLLHFWHSIMTSLLPSYSLSWSVRHRVPAAGGPGYSPPTWKYWTASSDWAEYLYKAFLGEGNSADDIKGNSIISCTVTVTASEVNFNIFSFSYIFSTGRELELEVM